MIVRAVATLVAFVFLPSFVAAQSGNVDPLLGPAIAVTQGLGMTEEIAMALRPGPEHDLLARLVGVWEVSGVAGRDSVPVHEVATFEPAFGGAWIIADVSDDAGPRRRIHLGFDAYRGAFAMWEIGRGFTSPMIRVGEYDEVSGTLRFRRSYTIRLRDEDERLEETLEIRLLATDRVEWTSAETIGSGPRRVLRHVTMVRQR